MVAEQEDYPEAARPYVKSEKLSSSSTPPSSIVVSKIF